MKIFVIVDQESNWIPKQLFLTFGRHSRLKLVDDAREADVIWIMSYYANIGALTELPWWAKMAKRFRISLPTTLRRRSDLQDKLIVATVHHLVPEKQSYYLPALKRVEKLADCFHIFARANANFCASLIHRPMFHLPYWIDLSVFTPKTEEEKLALRRQLGLPEGKRVIGSFQRDTERDLTTPKLEKGPDILCDVLERLDPERHFVLLSGPRRNYVESRLAAMGMPYKSLGFVEAARMPELYNAIDLYLVTSRVEGGPQSILESMACRTPIFSTPVGVSSSLAPSLIKSSVEALVEAIRQPYPDVLDDNLQNVLAYEAERVVGLYECAFHELVAAFRRDRENFVQSSKVEWVANAACQRP